MGAFPTNESEIEIVEARLIKRITFRNFISSVFDAFNISRGGVYSIKMLLKNPGQLARDYLGASRYRITEPFKMLIISTAIALLLFNAIHTFEGYLDESIKVSETHTDAKEKIIRQFIAYFNLILWTYIPVVGIFSFLFNRKKGFNYAENLVFQTFNLSLTNIIVIICFPLFFLSFNVFTAFAFPVVMGYMIYAYHKFFKKTWLRSIFESLIIFIIGSTIWSVLLVLFIILIAVSVVL